MLKKIFIILSLIVLMYFLVPNLIHWMEVYSLTVQNKTALSFVDEVASGHLDKAYEKTSTSFQDQIPRERFGSEVAMFANTGGVSSDTFGLIRDEKTSNDKATFGWALTTADRVGQYAGYHVIVSEKRENGEWKVECFVVRDQRTNEYIIKENASKLGNFCD